MDVPSPSVPPRFDGASDRVAYLLAEYRMGVYAAAVTVAVLVLSGRWGVPTIPPWLSDWMVAFAIGILPSMAAGKILIVDKFIPDPRQKVLEIRLDDDRSLVEMRPHRVPSDLWGEREHEHGEPVLEPEGPVDAVVSRFEYDDALTQIRVRGMNRELADPVDMLVSQGRLGEIYSGLLETQREHQQLKTTLTLRQQQMEERLVNALVGAVEQGTAFEPSSDIIRDEMFSDVDVDVSTGPVSDPDTNGSDREGRGSTVVEDAEGVEQ